jgi:hypothetical protein
MLHLQGLRWLSVQVAEEAAVTQRPPELGQYHRASCACLTNICCVVLRVQGLRWLSVQAAEEAAVTQRPLELGEYLWNGVEALTGLQELRIWLGFGVEGRQAQQLLVARVEAKLHDCRCHVLQEPEKPVL